MCEVLGVPVDRVNPRAVMTEAIRLGVSRAFREELRIEAPEGTLAEISAVLQTVELPAKQAALTFELPKQLQSSNVLVEITGAGQTKSRAY